MKRLSTKKVIHGLAYYFSGPIIIVALLIAGVMDTQSNNELLIDYCKQVKMGAWPNYKNISSEDCQKLLDEVESNG